MTNWQSFWLHRMQHLNTNVLAFKHCNCKHRVLVNTRKTKNKDQDCPADTNTNVKKRKKKKTLIFLAIAVDDKRRRKLKVRSWLEMSSSKKPNQVCSPTKASPKAFNFHISCSSQVHSMHLPFISSLHQIYCCLDTVSPSLGRHFVSLTGRQICALSSACPAISFS